MLLLSGDRWKYFAAGSSFTHFPLRYIYMGRGYKVVLEEKLRKYVLEFKKVKTTTRIWLPAIHVYATMHNKYRTYKFLSSKLLFALIIKTVRSAVKCTLCQVSVRISLGILY